ncbi:MAG: regulatory protein RecX [Desulfuromonadales bacterium]|nr:regulatory protein RecX [Desulfuromonadales bacterium]
MSNKAGPTTERSDPWPTALRLLTGRDYSHAELRRRLLDKGFAPAGVDAALQRCLEFGYLDDNRYALNRATSLMTQGRAVGPRILLDLRQRGISEEVACQALAKAREDCDESALLRSLLQRRFPDFNYSSAPAKERRRVVHFLQRRGFAIDRIMDQLTRKGFETHDEDR